MKKSLILLFSCLLSAFPVGCTSPSDSANPEPKKTTVWVGYPQDAPDWPYRYVFDSQEMKSGLVEYQRDGAWHLSGPLEDIQREKKAVTCKGPMGVPGKLLYIGFIFSIGDSSEDGSSATMSCDAFDSRAVRVLFKKESRDGRPLTDS